MFQFLKPTEGTVAEGQSNHIDRVVTEGADIVAEQGWDEKYPMLAAGLESEDPKEQYINAYTAILMRNQAAFVQQAARSFGESTVVANLGDIAPRIMDVVRVFAPNTVAHIIANAQPLSQMTGQVIVIKPTYSNTGGGVTAGDEVFKDSTDGFYASEVQNFPLATGDGSTAIFAGTLLPVRVGTVSVKVNAVEVGTDDGSGLITGSSITSGTVDYATGAVTITFTAAPAAGLAITIDYEGNHELSPDGIRELELGLNIIPVVAKPHPLRVTWSVQAQLAAMASIGLDVEDTMAVIAGQHLKVERDRQLIRFISNEAGAVEASLTFDAASVSGLSRREVFDDFAITVTKGENLIFEAAGRGSVAWIIAGLNAAVVIKTMSGFVPAADIIPIGAHVVGTLDGATVIKDPYSPTNEFILGYNGILPGDSGVIIADWIPLYFTATDMDADLRGRKALLSMYDIVVNVSEYYKKGIMQNV